MTRSARRTIVVTLTVVAWVVALWIMWSSVRRGRDLQRTAPEVFLGAAPLVGRNFRDGWDWRFGWSILGAAAVAGALVVSCWRRWWFRIRVRWVVVSTAVGSTLFALFLALVDGADGILYGAEHNSEYFANLADAPPAGEFVRTFTERIGDYSVHVRGHPPGFVLLLKVVDWFGVGGGWSTAMLSVLGTALVPVGVLVTVHQVAGADWVRRAAPFLVVAPYLIWMVTSADALYTGVAAVGIAAVATATRRRSWRAALAGLVGGLLLGAVMYGTYLGAVLLIVPGAIVVLGLRRRFSGALPAVIGALIGGLLVTVSFLVAGFWWFDGAAATKVEYWEGTAQFRKWDYFGLANIAAALIALGAAAFAGLLRLRDRRMWLIVGAALAALIASHLSQYTKAEVERIWLLFYPWITVAAASLFVAGKSAPPDQPPTVRRHRAAIWVAAQATSAIVLQSALVTKW